MYHLYTLQYNVHVPCVLCGVMVITLDLQSRACYTFIQWLWASCSHTCGSVIKQYNFVLVKERWCSVAEKLTVHLTSHHGLKVRCMIDVAQKIHMIL